MGIILIDNTADYSSIAVATRAAASYAAAIEAADGQSLESGVKNAIFNFVNGCRKDGIFDAIQSCCIFGAARTLAGALIPLVGPAPTNSGFVSGDYARETGLIGNGSSKHIVTGIKTNAQPQDSQHMAVWVSSPQSTAVASAYIGTTATSSDRSGIGRSALSTANLFHTSRNATNATTNGAGDATGFVGINRNSSSEYIVRAKGANSIVSAVSTTPTATDISVFRGFGAQYTDGRLGFYSVGTSVDLVLLDARVTTLMAALAAAIV